MSKCEVHDYLPEGCTCPDVENVGPLPESEQREESDGLNPHTNPGEAPDPEPYVGVPAQGPAESDSTEEEDSDPKEPVRRRSARPANPRQEEK
jgi:hypothetical protein